MTPVLEARKLVKRYGRVTAMDHADFEVMPGEILAVIGDNVSVRRWPRIPAFGASLAWTIVSSARGAGRRSC
jgi:hypothetical protein